jgi:hypothetical protein
MNSPPISRIPSPAERDKRADTAVDTMDRLNDVITPPCPDDEPTASGHGRKRKFSLAPEEGCAISNPSVAWDNLKKNDPLVSDSRLLAWRNLLQLEQFYRQFTKRVFDLKEQEIESLESSITGETNVELVSEMCHLEDQHVKWINCARYRLEVQLQCIDEEYRQLIYHDAVSTTVAVSNDRQMRVKELVDSIVKVNREYSVIEKRSLGDKIFSSPSLRIAFGADCATNPTVAPDTIVDEVQNPYAIPVVEQQRYQHALNRQCLVEQSQATARNDKDDWVRYGPPVFKPLSLNADQVDDDLVRIKMAISMMHGTPAVSSSAEDQ